MQTKPREIWLVEDDEDDILFYQQALQKIANKLPVVVLRDGVQALQKLRLQSPEEPVIMVIDGHMPKLSGVELAKIIYQECMAGRHRATILTGFITDSERELVESFGMQVLIKPADPELLTQTFRNILTANSAGK